MAGDVFSILGRLGLDTTKWRSELKQVRGDFNSFVTSWVTTAVTGGALVGMAKQAVDLASALKGQSLQLGINVEKLQVLNALARDAGVPQEVMQKALEKTRLAIEKARQGGEEQIKTLAKLGLTANELAHLPLEQKFERIAQAAKNSSNQAVAWNAVSELFGEKIGPKMQEILQTIATEGFAKLGKAAKENGDIMSAQTIVALEKAGNAIEAFKQRAVIALGNILVNFRSEDGLKLLLYQFLKVVGTFGAGIVDAVIEGGQMVWAVLKGAFLGVAGVLRDAMLDAMIAIAKKFNDVMPDWLKSRGWTINVAGLEELKNLTGSVGDEITKAIAETSPSTFKKEVGEFWDKRIHDQQLIVDAMNNKDFGKDATKLKDAGKNIEASVDNASAGLVDAGKKVADNIKEAALALSISRTGKSYEDQSTDSLMGVKSRLTSQLSQVDASGMQIKDATMNGNYGSWLTANTIKGELADITRELALRAEVSSYAARFGEAAARRAYGDTLTDRALRDIQTDTERTAVAVENLNSNVSSLNQAWGIKTTTTPGK